MPSFSNLVELHLTVVRHGETDGNARNVIQGTIDTPLNATGRAQAVKAGAWLKGREEFDSVYASTLSRAAETANLIVGQNPDAYKVDNIKRDNLLRERHFGVFENRSFDELVAAETAAGNGFGNFDPEGAETNRTMEDRIETFLKTLFQEVCTRRSCTEEIGDNRGRRPASVLVVTHGGWIIRMDRNLNRTNKIDKLTDVSLDEVSHKNTGITKFVLQLNKDTFELESGQCLLNSSVQHLM